MTTGQGGTGRKDAVPDRGEPPLSWFLKANPQEEHQFLGVPYFWATPRPGFRYGTWVVARATSTVAISWFQTNETIGLLLDRD